MGIDNPMLSGAAAVVVAMLGSAMIGVTVERVAYRPLRGRGKGALVRVTPLVTALGGEPGVDTAYYAGPRATYAENRAKLLAALDAVADRRADFITVVLVRWPDGHELVVRGVCPGTIAAAERGDRGFGFDPLFIPDDGDGRTFSEMSDTEKNDLSHRGRAFRELVRALREQRPLR